MLRCKEEASSCLEASVAAGLPPPPIAEFAVAFKLPDFCLHDAPSWFMCIEVQFALRGISSDDTKYHHVISYTDLKALLLWRFSLSNVKWSLSLSLGPG